MPEGVIFEVSHANDPWSPVWVDYTADLIHWETKRGKRLADGKMEAGQARFVVDNAATRGLSASRWDPNHPSLPLGSLEEWRPVRLRWDPGDGSGILPIFYGYLGSVTPAGNESVLACFDATKFFAQVPVPSAWEIEVLTNARAGIVTAWWTLGEVSGALENALTGVDAIAEVGVTRNQAPLLPSVSQGSILLNGSGYLVLPPESLSTSDFGMAITFKTTPVNRQQSLLSVTTPTGGLFEVGIYANNDATASLQGRLYVYYTDGAGKQGGLSIIDDPAGGGAPRLDDGEVHTVVATYRPGATYGQAAAITRFDGYTTPVVTLWPATGGSNPASFSYTNGIYVGQRYGGGQALNTNAQIDEVVFFNHGGSPLTYAPRLNRAAIDIAFDGWASAPYTRIPALLDTGAWPAALRVAGDYTSGNWTTITSSTGLAQIVEPSNRTLLEHLEAAAGSVLGEIFLDRAGQFRAYGPGGLPAAVAATFGSAGLPFTSGDPLRTDAFPAVLIDPSSDNTDVADLPAAYGLTAGFASPLLVEDPTTTVTFLPRRSYKHTIALTSRTGAAAVAAALLTRVKTPRTYWPKLTIPTNGLTLAQRKTLLGLELLDRATVNAAPIAGGYSLAVDSRIAGIGHKGDPGSNGKGKWRTDIYSAPNA